MSKRIVKGSFLEGAPVSLEAEWARPGGVLWQQVDFSSCRLRIFDYSVGSQVASPSRSVAETLTNEPMAWELSATGNNFHDMVLTSDVQAEGGHTYQFEYGFTRADGFGIEYLVFQARCDGIGSA